MCVGLENYIHLHAHISRPRKLGLHVVFQVRNLRAVLLVGIGADRRLACCVFGAGMPAFGGDWPGWVAGKVGPGMVGWQAEWGRLSGPVVGAGCSLVVVSREGLVGWLARRGRLGGERDSQ